MGRWIMATALALSTLTNVVVLSKLASARRDTEELRRRPTSRGIAEAAPAAIPIGSATPAAAREPGPAPLDAAPSAPDRHAIPAPAPASATGVLADLERIDDFWKTLKRLESHRDTLGAEYQRAIFDLTASFTGVDGATLAAAARQYATDCEADVEDPYGFAAERFKGHFRADLRTHRSLIARVDEWISYLQEGSRSMTGAVFELEGDK
jgi:hypothetical protein